MKSVHSLLQFQQLCDETLSWINEKDQTLSTEDCGRDLPSVQTLQRKHMVATTMQHREQPVFLQEYTYIIILSSVIGAGERVGTSGGETAHAHNYGAKGIVYQPGRGQSCP